jgi:hypothetical protein
MYTQLGLNYEEQYGKNELYFNSLIQSSREEGFHPILKTLFLKREVKEGVEIKIGYDLFNISAMEGFKTANIFNAQDFTNNFLDPIDMGEPVLAIINTLKSGSTWEFMYHLDFQANVFPTHLNRSNGRVEIRQDEYFDVLNGVDPPETTPPNKFIVSSIFSSYGGWADYKIFGHFGYDKKYPFFLVDTAQNTVPLYMPDTILGFSLTKPVKSFLVKVEMARHLFKLDLPSTGSRYNRINPLYSASPPQRDRFTEYTLGLEYLKTIKNYDVTFFLEHIVMKLDDFSNYDIGFLKNDILFASNFNFNDQQGSSLKFSYTRSLDSEFRETMNFNYESEWMPKVRYNVELRTIKVDDTQSSTNFVAFLPVEEQFVLRAKYFF